MYGVYSTVPCSAVCMMYPPTLSLNNDEMTDMNDGGADGKKRNKAGKRGATETVNHLPAPGLTVTPEPKNQNQTSSGK